MHRSPAAGALLRATREMPTATARPISHLLPAQSLQPFRERAGRREKWLFPETSSSEAGLRPISADRFCQKSISVHRTERNKQSGKDSRPPYDVFSRSKCTIYASEAGRTAKLFSKVFAKYTRTRTVADYEVELPVGDPTGIEIGRQNLLTRIIWPRQARY